MKHCLLSSVGAITMKSISRMDEIDAIFNDDAFNVQS
jgi:hypothetical protein